MNRETRKANLRKLQLPGTSTARKTRSTRTVTTAISQYFTTPTQNNIIDEASTNNNLDGNTQTSLDSISETQSESCILICNPPANIENNYETGSKISPKCMSAPLSQQSPSSSPQSEEATKPKRLKRTKLTSFLCKDKNDVANLACDFEMMDKNTKKAPKAKTSTGLSKNNRTRSKRQQSIKSAFLRNEQIFSEITAQHCMADNFSPDDIQLALAMSKSEAEKGGILTADDAEEIVVNVGKEDVGDAQEVIRNKLRRYGFRTATKEDYNTITAAFHPSGGTNRRNISKWANKFTALTLRDPAQQLKIVNEKVDNFLSKQLTTKPLSEKEGRLTPYHINSGTIRSIKPLQQEEVFSVFENFQSHTNDKFYVQELFDVSLVKPGHLLKNWRKIPGRDSTPKNKNFQKRKKEKANAEKFLRIYQELEMFFSKPGVGYPNISHAQDIDEHQLSKTESINATTLESDIENVANSLKHLGKTNGFSVPTEKSCKSDAHELDKTLQLIENMTPEYKNVGVVSFEGKRVDDIDTLKASANKLKNKVPTAVIPIESSSKVEHELEAPKSYAENSCKNSENELDKMLELIENITPEQSNVKDYVQNIAVTTFSNDISITSNTNEAPNTIKRAHAAKAIVANSTEPAVKVQAPAPSTQNSCQSISNELEIIAVSHSKRTHPEKNHIAECPSEIQTTSTHELVILLDSPLKELPDKKLKHQCFYAESKSDCSEKITTLRSMQKTRATSPDIFADSDEEADAEICDAASFADEKKISHDEQPCITTFEIYSSDEVKTSSCADKNTSEPLAEAAYQSVIVVDLTQVNSIASGDVTSQLNILNEDSDIFSSSPIKAHETNCQHFIPRKKITVSTDVLNAPQEKNVVNANKKINSFQPYFNRNETENLQQANPTNNDIIKKNKQLSAALNSDDDDVLMEIELSEGNNSFFDLQGDKQMSTSFHFQTALHKETSTANDTTLEAPSESIFLALQRKYLDVENSTKSSRKSVPATQLIVPASKCSPKGKKRLSFTQMEQQIYDAVSDKKTSVICFNSSKSPFKATDASDESIDLTQNCEDSDGALDANDEDDCIILSDDEINYSIWKADKTMNLNADEEPPILTQDLTLSSDSETEKSSPMKQKGDQNVRKTKKQSPTINEHAVSYQVLLKANKSFNTSHADRKASAPDFNVADKEPPILTQDLTMSSDSEAEKSTPLKQIGSQNLIKNKKQSPTLNEHEFSYQELMDVNKSFNNLHTGRLSTALDSVEDLEPLQSQFLATQSDGLVLYDETPTKSADLSKKRAEFGIIDCFSESPTQSQFKTPIKQIKSMAADLQVEDSFLGSPSEKSAPMKRYSSSKSSQKFNALLQQVQNEDKPFDTATDFLDDYDEFDRLVYGTPKFKKTLAPPIKPPPIGLQQLLTAELSFCEEPCGSQRITTPKKLYISPSKNALKTPDKNDITSPTKRELNINGKTYEVRVVTTPKPDFSGQSDAELLKQLYNYGIKPLKRKQALLMLEYIYNQTHPILLNEGEEVELTQPINEVKPEEEYSQSFKPIPQSAAQSQEFSQAIVGAGNSNASSLHVNKLNLCDCVGYILLRHQHHLYAELPDEDYIFQTNVSKKLYQALLPLHVAWFNLVCSSTVLHEAILMFEPIDLQECYLFFKSIGYRYDPKDLKSFFDRRCIIFRYDLGAPGKQGGNNRHVRKSNRNAKVK